MSKISTKEQLQIKVDGNNYKRRYQLKTRLDGREREERERRERGEREEREKREREGGIT